MQSACYHISHPPVRVHFRLTGELRQLCSTDASLDEFELLIRSILIRPDSPAVLILGHFSPQVAETRGFAGADHWHSLVAHYYDIPHVRYVAELQ